MDVWASFRLLGETLEPEELMREFGIQATSACRQDESRWQSPETGRPMGTWTLDSQLDPSHSVVSHLEFLLDRLEPAAPSIARKAATPGWICGFYCSIFVPDTGTKGTPVDLPPSLLSRAASLGATLELRLYVQDSGDE